MADMMVIFVVMIAMIQIVGVTMLLMIMATYQDKEWHPSQYQPMELLMARGRKLHAAPEPPVVETRAAA